MQNFIREAFMYIGMIASICILSFIGIVAYGFVRTCIDKARRKYRYKHRFDKPPTAKCYCIDCRYWDRETGRCYRFPGDLYTADIWFCWKAEPREE